MTIREFLVHEGYLRIPTGTKALCPFHGDRNPSAKVDDDTNSLYCFACRRVYGPQDFYVRFGIVLDVIKSKEAQPGEITYEWGEPLFFA